MVYELNRHDTEKYIIGYALSHGEYARQNLEKFNIDRSEFFLHEECVILFNGILQAYRLNKIPTLLNIANYSKMSKSNSSLLTENYTDRLISNYASDCLVSMSSLYSPEYMIHYFIELILKQYWKVEADKIQSDDLVIEDIFDFAGDIIDRYKELEDHLLENLKDDNGLKSIAELESQKRIKALAGEINNPPHYLESVNAKTGGFNGSEFTILAGRPGMGKTTVVLILSIYLTIEHSMKISFFSLEMPKLKLMNKIISWKTGIPFDKIRDYNTSEKEWKKIVEWYDYFEHPDCPLKIFTNPNFDSIINSVKETKPNMAIIDYLQLITVKNKKFGNREQEVSYISKNLKLAANKQDIPFIALSQLNRSLESRSNKRPLLSDLRESGSLEQDADNVVFLYRESYYKQQSGDYFPPHELWNIEWIEAKNRMNGPFIARVNINLINGEYQDSFKEFD